MARKDKELHIVEAAARVFARKGFAGSLISDIAQEAGIGKGTVYEYFASKNDLFFAVFEWFNEQVADTVRVSIGSLSGSASRRLEVMVESVIHAEMEMEDNVSLFMEFWAAASSSHMRSRFTDTFRRAYDDFRQIVSDLIHEGISRGEFKDDLDVASIAAGLVGCLDGIFLQAWFDKSFDPAAAAKSFTAYLIAGMSEESQAGGG